jgi:acyl-CoA synthetase (AMP-forming)/AMP-acid ligase II
MLPDDLRALTPLIYAHVTPLRDFSARHELDVADSVVALFAAEQCQDNGIDLSGSKMLIGGGALPRALAREALELGLDVYGGYGMSETCTVLTTGEAYCLGHHVTIDGGKQRLMLASLRYLDTFVKTDGEWLFAERRLYVDWLEERALS